MKTLREQLATGKVVFGGTVTEHLRPSIVKAYANAGFDFIFLENEHAAFDPARLSDFVLCARDNGLTVVAKTGQLDRAETARLLEMGVMGFQLPRTESPQEMATLYDYIKFPPKGSRASASGYGNSFYAKVDKSVWYQQTNEQTMLICHIETRQGVEDVDQILSVDGIDVCFIGSSDLSLCHGVLGHYTDPRFLALVEKIFASAAQRKIVRGLVASDYETARYWIDRGVQFFECVNELDLISSGAEKAVEQLHRARGD